MTAAVDSRKSPNQGQSRQTVKQKAVVANYVLSISLVEWRPLFDKFVVEGRQDQRRSQPLQKIARHFSAGSGDNQTQSPVRGRQKMLLSEGWNWGG